jgi:DNA-binding NarL/FixJ family response regulator
LGTEGPIRLLICDDHRVLTDALVVVVRGDSSLELVAPPVHSPSEAVRLCGELHPDVVLMDISFEEAMSGIDATHQIKEASPGTSVVIMTAYHDDALLIQAVEAGASAYLSKTEGAEAVLTAARAAAHGEVLFDPRNLASRHRPGGQAARGHPGPSRPVRSADGPGTRGSAAPHRGTRERGHRGAARDQPVHGPDTHQQDPREARGPVEDRGCGTCIEQRLQLSRDFITTPLLPKL